VATPPKKRVRSDNTSKDQDASCNRHLRVPPALGKCVTPHTSSWNRSAPCLRCPLPARA
jgi:hypothetical protein